MKRLSALLILVTFLTGALRAQTSSTQIPKTFFSGYERALHGGGFIYHSPDPAVTSSMLVRSEDSTAAYSDNPGPPPQTVIWSLASLS